MWVVNNEGWGQYDSATLARSPRGMDPSRLVNADSGWLDVADSGSDIFDIHTYEDVPRSRPQPHAPIVIGEYGGVGCPSPAICGAPIASARSYQSRRIPRIISRAIARKFEEIVRQAREPGAERFGLHPDHRCRRRDQRPADL
jgi:hypothetical protein